MHNVINNPLLVYLPLKSKLISKKREFQAVQVDSSEVTGKAWVVESVRCSEFFPREASRGRELFPAIFKPAVEAKIAYARKQKHIT